MKRSEIILPGHYCSKASLDADSKEIVRILGRASREGYWITDDKKELPEYVLLEDYVPLDTLAAKPKQKFGTDIFRDFQEVEISDVDEVDEYDNSHEKTTIENTTENIRDEIRSILRDVLKEHPVTVQKPRKNKSLSDETLSIINKASIVVLNDNYEKKYGDRPYKQHTIQLNLQLPINYDLEKLRQIIELFELDEREIARYLAQNIEIDYAKITDNILQSMLGVDSIKRVQRSKEIIQLKSQSNENQLDSGIKEIDGILTKYLNRKDSDDENT